MAEYYFEKQGAELLDAFCEALEEVSAATEQLAQYVAFYYDRDRYAFLEKVAHCCNYCYLVDSISKCFDNLSERQQGTYFQV